MLKTILNGDKLKVASVTILAFLTLPYQVLGYYCDHDFCGTEQYCCGDNLCCDYVYSLWYFWVGVALFVLVVSACGGFYRYIYDTKQYREVPYFQPFSDNEKMEKQFLEKDSIDYSCLPPNSRKPESHPTYRAETDKKSYMFV